MFLKKKINIKNTKFGKKCEIIQPVNIYGATLRDNIFVGPFVEIQKDVIIDNNTRIQSHSFVCEKVRIGKNCFIGHGVKFINDKFKQNKILKNKKNYLKTIIGNNVLIGSNSTILPVNIISGVVIGAGSVVTKNIFKKGTYCGNPAKLIKS